MTPTLFPTPDGSQREISSELQFAMGKGVQAGEDGEQGSLGWGQRDFFWLFFRIQKPGWGLRTAERLHQASCQNKFLCTPPVKFHFHLLPKLELWLFQLMTSLTGF